jgi:ABC-type enterochelin transport system substrate-binding protein
MKFAIATSYCMVRDATESNKPMTQNVYVTKGPASCPHTVGNACDRSDLFKATKTVLKHSKDHRDSALQKKVENSSKDRKIPIKPNKVVALADGLVRIVNPYKSQ